MSVRKAPHLAGKHCVRARAVGVHGGGRAAPLLRAASHHRHGIISCASGRHASCSKTKVLLNTFLLANPDWAEEQSAGTPRQLAKSSA